MPETKTVRERLLVLLGKEFGDQVKFNPNHSVIYIPLRVGDNLSPAVEVEPTLAGRYYRSQDSCDAVRVNFRIRFKDHATRYPLNKEGNFNETKLIERIRTGLTQLQQAEEAEKARTVQALNEEAQREILDTELKSQGVEMWRWRFDLVRSEKDGKPVYKGKVEFFDLPWETVKQIIALSGRA